MQVEGPVGGQTGTCAPASAAAHPSYTSRGVDKLVLTESRPNIEEIRRLPGAADAEWVDPPKKATLFVDSHTANVLDVARMLSVGGLFLVETTDKPGIWCMGQEDVDDVVTCWGYYGPLAAAVQGL
jgi:hypothetical protein